MTDLLPGAVLEVVFFVEMDDNDETVEMVFGRVVVEVIAARAFSASIWRLRKRGT